MQFDPGIQRLGDPVQEGRAGEAGTILQPGERGLARSHQITTGPRHLRPGQVWVRPRWMHRRESC